MTPIERSWYRPFGWSLLLWPLSLLFAVLTCLRRWLYRFGCLRATACGAPVIVIGNITVGGTGKTPITLWMAEFLKQQGLKPGIISRGYGVTIASPRLVKPEDRAQDVGDEPLLLAQRSGCPVVIFPNRVAAAQYLLAHTDCNIILSDDGLQHYALKRDLEVVLLDGNRGLGNGCLLPAGPLREGAWRLSQADLVLVNSQPHPLSPWVFQLQPLTPCPLAPSTQPLPEGSAVSLVSGIANPARFERTVRDLGYPVLALHRFADHHPFGLADLQSIATPLLMTEKDAVKCREFAQADWYYLPVRAIVPAAAITILTEKLSQIRSRYGL